MGFRETCGEMLQLGEVLLQGASSLAWFRYATLRGTFDSLFVYKRHCPNSIFVSLPST